MKPYRVGMIPTERRSTRAAINAWEGILARARLRAYFLRPQTLQLDRVEDVVPEEDLLRRADHLDELKPGSWRKRHSLKTGGIAAKIPVLGRFLRLRDELAAIREFCDAAAAGFAELADRVAELERRLDSIDTNQR